MTFSDQFLEDANPDNIRNIILQQGREIEALKQAVISLQQLSGIADDIGDVFQWYGDGDPHDPLSTNASGFFVAPGGLTVEGDDYVVGQFDNGVLQWGSMIGGALRAGRGSIDIDADGINLLDGGDALFFYDSTNHDVAIISFQPDIDLNPASFKIIVLQLEDFTDIITNGSFETGDFTGWTENDSFGKLSISSDYSADGLYALKIDAGEEGYDKISQSISGGAPNGVLMRLRVLITDPTDSLSYVYLDGGGSNSQGVVPGYKGNWKTLYLFITGNTTDISISINGIGAPFQTFGDIYIDKVEAWKLSKKPKVWQIKEDGTGLPLTGEIRLYAHQFSLPPSGWLSCDGSAVSRTTYAELFAAIGTVFGAGNGSTTFNVPDFRGRAPIGVGLGTGLTNRALGAQVGDETHVLTTAQLPAHTHTVPSRANPTAFGANSRAAEPSGTGTTTNFASGSAGSGQGHNNMQPSLAVRFIIKT